MDPRTEEDLADDVRRRLGARSVDRAGLAMLAELSAAYASTPPAGP